jgi:hypothetical protein
MIDEETLAQINGPYRCPPDAGPAWRAACNYGFDMSLVETCLEMTPERRERSWSKGGPIGANLLTPKPKRNTPPHVYPGNY